MKRLFSVLLLLALVVSAQAQLLWKVSGNGLAQPSYIVGTYHLAPASFVDSIPGLKDALSGCRQVYGELSLQELTDMGKLQQMQQAMMLPDSVKLQDLFTPEQTERLNAFMRSLLGADLSTAMVGEQLSRMKPAALSAQLQVLLYVKLHPEFNMQQLFDMAILQAAAGEGKTVGGLETLAFQTRVLYGSQTLQRQAESLLCLADHRDYMEDVAERLTKAFFAQDLEAVETISEEKMNNRCDSSPEEDELLIYGRNADWAKKLPTIMQTAPTLVAVGCAHLPGERGLLALLRQAGYEVTPVSPN